MSSKQAACQKESANRAQEIATAWYQAIAGTAFVPYSAKEICDRLVDLVEDSLTVLHADSFLPQEAQAIGAALVDLHYTQGESLGASVELLARDLSAGLPADELLDLRPRISSLLGGISHGFFQQASTAILAEQESVRRADVEAMKALQADRQRQQENLLETHERLKAQMKERELQRTAERLEALHQIESGILQAESPQAIAEVALQHMERIIPSTASTVTLYQSSYTEVVMLAGRNLPLKPGAAVPTPPDQVAARKRGEVQVIMDIAALPMKTAGQQLLLDLGGRSLLAVPLLFQGELTGTLSLIDASPNAFSEQDVRITRQVGNLVAIALHNSRLLEMEKNARREAETLREVAAGINASLDQEELLSLILTQLKRVLHFDSASIWLYQKGSWGVVAHQGLLVQAAEAYKQAEHLPANLIRLALEKQPQIISDTLDDPEWVIYPGGEIIRCWLGVPLMVKEELIGLLMLNSPEPNFYKKPDAALALAFANHAAIAIENANLYREIKQYAEVLETHVGERTRDLGALYEITAIMSQHLELKATLDKIVEVILEALEIETVSIQIIDQSHSMLRLAAYKNLFPMMIEYLREQPVTNPIMEGILDRRGASLYIDPPSASELADMPVSDISSYGVASPIRAKGKNLGILAIAYHRQKEPTPEDLALLASIAAHIGSAIENTRLRQQSEQLAVLEERERLARDLHDSATQSLFTLTLFAAAASEYLKNEQLEAVEKQLVELEETAVQTHKEMRLLLYELRPTVLEKEDLEEALQQRLQMVEVRSGIRGHVSVKLSAKLPVSVEQVLFQVANEALNNTLKHSGADTVTIDITAGSSHVSMEIRDNGQGFIIDNADFYAGMGMGNMRQRVRKMGGTFHYESQPKSGTNIVVHIPLEPEEPVGEY